MKWKENIELETENQDTHHINSKQHEDCCQCTDLPPGEKGFSRYHRELVMADIYRVLALWQSTNYFL